MILLSIFGCKTITIKDTKRIEGNVLFKNLLSSSEALKQVSIATSVMISGNKQIPPLYIKLNIAADLENKEALLNFSVLSKPLFDIVYNPEKLVLINHTNTEYIEFSAEDVQIGDFIGLNFNPIDLCYLLTGNVPYSDDLNLVEFIKKENNNLDINITNTTTNFFLSFNNDDKISVAKVENQFFDPLKISTLSFTKDAKGGNIPLKIKVSSEGIKTYMTFLIRSFNYDTLIKEDYEKKIPTTYKKLTDVRDIKIQY